MVVTEQETNKKQQATIKEMYKESNALEARLSKLEKRKSV